MRKQNCLSLSCREEQKKESKMSKSLRLSLSWDRFCIWVPRYCEVDKGFFAFWPLTSIWVWIGLLSKSGPVTSKSGLGRAGTKTALKCHCHLLLLSFPSRGRLWSLAAGPCPGDGDSPRWRGRLFRSQRCPASWEQRRSQRRVVCMTSGKFQPWWKLWHQLKGEWSKNYLSMCFTWMFRLHITIAQSANRCCCRGSAFKRLEYVALV